MNRKAVQWLEKEIPRVFIVGLGLLLILLGVFLLFAGYWYSFSPNGRFDWIIGLVALTLVAVGLVRCKTPSDSLWREVISVLYFFVMALSTYLVGDTYDLGNSYGLFVFLTTILCLPMAYFMDSSFLMGIYMLSAAYWVSTNHGSSFVLTPFFVWVLIACAIPFYRKAVTSENKWSQSRLFLSWSLVIAIYMAFFFTFTNQIGIVTILILTNLGVITYGLGMMTTKKGFWLFPFRSMGVLGLLYVVYMATFKGSWSHIYMSQSMSIIDGLFAVFSLLIALYLIYKMAIKQYYLGVLAGCSSPVVGLCIVAAKSGVSPLLITVLFDLYVLFVAAMYIIKGTLQQKINLINGGIVAIIVMVLARFFDPGFTFIERGISFVIVGIILLVANSLYMWKKSRQHVSRKRYGIIEPEEKGDDGDAT